MTRNPLSIIKTVTRLPTQLHKRTLSDVSANATINFVRYTGIRHDSTRQQCTPLPYKIELTYLQKNDPEKQCSRSKNCLNTFLNFIVGPLIETHVFGCISICTQICKILKLQIHSKNQRHFRISRCKLRQRVHGGHSFLLCQRNKRIFS